MGILLEADYKGVVSGKESIMSGLSRAFSSTKAGSSNNPLDREPGAELGKGERDGQITYELMNRDSAIALAQESEREGVKTFVYISAAAGAPVLPTRYITTKREAESTIANNMTKLRNVFVRPGFLYDSSRKFTLPIAASGMVGHTVNSMVGGSLTRVFGAAVEKPLKADLVADAVVEAIADDSTKGVLDTKLIEALAAKAWRRTML
jgi:nucleoside-diphosphate-sugar epimerase